MKPSTLILKETLTAGLRPSDRSKRNQPNLVECTGIRPSQYGLSAFEEIIAAIDEDEYTAESITPAWPYPQIFRGAQVTLLVTETGLWTVDEATWLLTAVTTYDAATPASTKAIVAGGTWHFVDFQDCWLLFNGSCVVYKRPDNAKTFVRTAVIRTACEHGNRLFIGGLDTIWSADWKTLVDTWCTHEPAAFDEDLYTPTNLVFWTNVSTLGLFWYLFDTTTAVAGDLSTHAAGDPFVRNLLLRGDWGFAPLPYQGRVYALRSLGPSVVAYSEGGVAALTPGAAPLPSCRVTPLSPTGIFGRSAIAATKHRHLWLSNEYYLWATTTEGVQRLDYGEYGTLLNTPVVGTADENDGLLYLADGTTALCLSDTGLFKAPQCPSSVIHAGNLTRGILFDSGNVGLEVVVNATDFGVRGAKTIDEVRVAGTLSDDGALTVALDYRDYAGEAFSRSDEEKTNDEGVAFFNLTADEFRVVLLAEDYAGVNVDYVEVSFRVNDQRYTERTRPQVIEA